MLYDPIAIFSDMPVLFVCVCVWGGGGGWQYCLLSIADKVGVLHNTVPTVELHPASLAPYQLCFDFTYHRHKKTSV